MTNHLHDDKEEYSLRRQLRWTGIVCHDDGRRQPYTVWWGGFVYKFVETVEEAKRWLAVAER